MYRCSSEMSPAALCARVHVFIFSSVFILLFSLLTSLYSRNRVSFFSLYISIFLSFINPHRVVLLEVLGTWPQNLLMSGAGPCWAPCHYRLCSLTLHKSVLVHSLLLLDDCPLLCGLFGPVWKHEMLLYFCVSRNFLLKVDHSATCGEPGDVRKNPTLARLFNLCRLLSTCQWWGWELGSVLVQFNNHRLLSLILFWYQMFGLSRAEYARARAPCFLSTNDELKMEK